MSLFALPVTVGDLTQLQTGIEFFTNTTEATTQAASINAGTQTVAGYAQQLIDNNIALSQVVAAVDSLMFGVVDTQAEMTALTTGFLPAQLAFFNSLPSATQAGAGGAIVWDAEVTGFALSGPNGNNGANQANFANTFAALDTGANAGAAGNTAFAQAVSTAVFGNTSQTNQVLAFLNSFISFFTTNPSALDGASLLQAADGITFGTEVGIALSNTATLGAYLEGLVSNVLIDISESALQAGFNILHQVSPIQLEGAAAAGKSFTLTPNTDTFTTGTGNDIYNAPFTGNGNQIQTLTSGDALIDSGSNNVLNAFLLGPVNNLEIAGIQTWNFTNFSFNPGAVTTVFGSIPGFFGATGPIGGLANPGVQTITFQNSVGSLEVGSSGLSGGVQSLLMNLNVAADTLNLNGGVGPNGEFPSVNVYIAANLFTGTDALNVNINALNEPNIILMGQPIPFGSPYGIIAGPDQGRIGYQTWNLNILDSAGDTILLGPEGATNAKTINIADMNGATGGLQLDALANTNVNTSLDWANVTTINGTGMAGRLVISGEEGGLFASGFLSADKVITTVTAGTGGLFVDLSSLSAAGLHALITVNGGMGLGEVAFNNSAMVATTAPVALTNIDVLDDASSSQGGAINMANFPLVADPAVINDGVTFAELQFVSSTPFDTLTGDILGSGLAITNGLTDFFVRFNSMNMNSQSVTISAGLANLNNANDVLEVGLSPIGSVSNFVVVNYTTVDLLVSGTDTVGTDNFIDIVPMNAPYGPGADISGTGNIVLGHTVGASLGLLAAVGVATVLITGNHPGINTNGGLSGWIDIGAANVSMLDASQATNLVMEEPGTNTATGIVALGGTDANGHTNQLQGTMGVQTPDSLGNGYIGSVGFDVLVGSVGADQMFGDGGPDIIDMHSAGSSAATDSEAYIGLFQSGFAGTVSTPIAPVALYTQDITDISAGSETYVNGYGSDATGSLTINGFVTGSTGDILNLNAGSWIGTFIHQALTAPVGINTDIGLVQDDGATNVSTVEHNATLQLDVDPGVVIPGSKADIVLDGIASYATSAALVTALKTTGVGDLILQGTGLAANTEAHMLIVYSTGTSVNVADVLLQNTTESNVTDTTKLTVSAFDLVQIMGQSGTPVATLGKLDPHNIHFIPGVTL
jgi:hypothetical protein